MSDPSESAGSDCGCGCLVVLVVWLTFAVIIKYLVKLLMM